MADVYLTAPARKTMSRAVWRLIRDWRAARGRARVLRLDRLSEHLQRDLGFRDGRATPTPFERPDADWPAWR